jgi:hypothetical protein
MEEEKYRVVFTGRIAEGLDKAAVLRNLCALFKAEPAKVKGRFAGKGAVIAGTADRGRAEEIARRIGEAGALCEVVEAIPPQPEPAVPLPSPAAAERVREEPLALVRPRLKPEEERPITLARRPKPPPAGEPSRMPDQPLPPLSDPPRRIPDTTAPPWRPAAPQAAPGPGIFPLLFKLLILAALGWGGWEGYRRYLAPPTQAFAAYATYADAMAREEYGKAEEASIGAARAKASSVGTLMAPTQLNVYGKSFSMNKPSIKEIAGEVTWIKRKRHSERKTAPETVQLDVTQTVCRIPPGVSSALCKWPVSFHQEVEVQLSDGAWKVASFSEERIETAGGK